MLWLVLVCMAWMGFGIGTIVVAFQVLTEATMLASVVGRHFALLSTLCARKCALTYLICLEYVGYVLFK